MKRLGFLFSFVLLATTVDAQFATSAFWRHRNLVLAYTTTAQSLPVSDCSGKVTVQSQSTAGAAVNVTSNLTVTLAGPGSLTFYSDGACTSSITQVTITSGTSSSNFYFIDTSSGSAAITAAAMNYATASQTETISSNGFVWSGGGGNANWSTAANWSGGVVPGSGNVALFDGTCSSNCSPTIAASINVAGVRIVAGYTGTITQSTGSTITVGSSGWSQQNGTFTGSSGGDAITIGGPYALAGGSFTTTSGTLTVQNTFVVSNSPTFSANGGTVDFADSCCTDLALTPNGITVNNALFNTNNGGYTLTGTLNVAGDLTLNDQHGAGSGHLDGTGTIQVSGNVTDTAWNGGTATIALVGSGTQTLTGGGTASLLPSITIASSGTVNLSGTIALGQVSTVTNFIYSSGTIAAGTSTLFLTGGCSTLNANISGASSFNNVTFSVAACSGQNFVVSGTLKMNGTLNLNNGGGTYGNITGGAIQTTGDVNVTNFGGTISAGSTVISVVGSGTQTITGSATSSFPGLTIASTGTVNLSGTLQFNGGPFTYTSGTLNVGTTTLLFSGGCSTTSLSPGTATYYNVTFRNSTCTGENYTLTGTLNVSNSFILDIGTGNLTGGTVAASGSVSLTSGHSTSALTFNGTSAQTVYQSSTNLPTGAITVNNSAGLSLLSNVTWNSTGQLISVTSGNVAMSGYNMTLHSLALNSNTIHTGGGVLTVNGTTYGSGSYFGGTVANP